MLIQILSALVQQSRRGHPIDMVVNMVVGRGNEPHNWRAEVCFQIHNADFAAGDALLQTALLMAQSLAIEASVETEIAAGVHALRLLLPQTESKPILIVEDNAGAYELYVRYLQGGLWQPVPLSDPICTIEQAQRMELQLAAVPVIICSVSSDTGLELLDGLDYVTRAHNVA